MGSGISTKYEKTYFYSKGTYTNQYEEKEESKEDWLVSEDSPKYDAGTDTHTIEYSNEEEVTRFCNEMNLRNLEVTNDYSQNEVVISQHFKVNEQGLFGTRSKNGSVRIIESNEPMRTAMEFYSEISKGGKTSYLANHHGIATKLKGDFEVYFRPYPKSEGSPVVEIKNIVDGFAQKIHFIKR